MSCFKLYHYSLIYLGREKKKEEHPSCEIHVDGRGREVVTHSCSFVLGGVDLNQAFRPGCAGRFCFCLRGKLQESRFVR